MAACSGNSAIEGRQYADSAVFTSTETGQLAACRGQASRLVGLGSSHLDDSMWYSSAECSDRYPANALACDIELRRGPPACHAVPFAAPTDLGRIPPL